MEKIKILNRKFDFECWMVMFVILGGLLFNVL